MKKKLCLKNILVAGGGVLVLFFVLFLFAEAFFNSNFRTTQDKVWMSHSVNVDGLSDVKASGGTAVRFWDLKRRLSHVGGNITIVDAISEYHGYVRGVPTSFFAYQHPEPHWKYFVRRLVFTGTTFICPALVTAEEEEAKDQGFSYVNVKVGSKFLTSKEAIDEFVQVMDNLPSDAWIHFHCHYGKGRTSIMMVMYDIMKNAPAVSLEDIVKRQHFLGSEDLMDREVRKKGSYTQKQLDDRRRFIEDFYKFICQRKTGGIQKWSEWYSSAP